MATSPAYMQTATSKCKVINKSYRYPWGVYRMLHNKTIILPSSFRQDSLLFLGDGKALARALLDSLPPALPLRLRPSEVTDTGPTLMVQIG